MSTQTVTPIQKVKSPRPHQNTVNEVKMRIAAIEAGRSIKVPDYHTILAVEDLVTHILTRMGCFSSDRQAVAFAVSGRVLYDPIPLNAIFESQKESRSGFFGFDLNETQIRHLLGTHRLMFGNGRYQSSREVTLYTDALEVESAEPWVVDIEMPSTKPLSEGRKFR